MPRKRTDNKEEALTSAATSLFLRRGIRATSVKDISESAGVAVGTFYLYFPNKVSLIRRIAHVFAEQHEQMSDAVLRRADLPSAKLSAYLLELSDMWQPFGENQKGSLDLAAAILQHASETLDMAKERFLKTVGAILNEGKRTGMFVADPEVEARWIALATSSFYPLAGTPTEHPLRQQLTREDLVGFTDWLTSKLRGR